MAPSVSEDVRNIVLVPAQCQETISSRCDMIHWTVNDGAQCVMKVRETIRMLEDDGWFLVATRGSHRQYKHPTKPGRVTIAGKPSDDLAPGTQNSILKQSG